MDHSQITYFKSRYAAMSEHELVYIVAARLDHLTEEAQFALKEVLESRNIATLEADVKATAIDLAAQAQHEQEEERKRASHRASMRIAILIACAILTVVGGVIAVVSNPEKGLIIAGLGIGLAVFSEVRRLLGKLVVAMFRMS